MTHPHILHALAAAASLAAALAALEQRAREAAADAIAGNTGSRDVPLSSPAWGRRHALGGHGDPTAALALGAWAPGGPNPHAALLGDLMRELDHMAAHLPGAPGQDPLARITGAVPSMRPHIAARTRQALEHLDGQARKRLQLPAALTPLPGNPPCPACHLQLLQQTAAGPVVCTGDCHCTGDGCGCGMPVRVEGVGHIWLPEHLPSAAGAVAGAAQTATTGGQA